MRKNVPSSFIQLIWEIVSDPQTDSIISWNPNGTSFWIIDPLQFVDGVLKKHFKHANISSFVRQLNMYNFHKNKANTSTQEFYHKLFRRDARQLLIGIRRKPSEADYQEGEELLRNYLSKKESGCGDMSRVEMNEINANQFPIELCNLIKHRLSLNEESLCTNCSPLPQEIPLVSPKKILNIIIVDKPLGY